MCRRLRVSHTLDLGLSRCIGKPRSPLPPTSAATSPSRGSLCSPFAGWVCISESVDMADSLASNGCCTRCCTCPTSVLRTQAPPSEKLWSLTLASATHSSVHFCKWQRWQSAASVSVHRHSTNMAEAVLQVAGAEAGGDACVGWSSVRVWREAVAVHVAVPPRCGWCPATHAYLWLTAVLLLCCRVQRPE